MLRHMIGYAWSYDNACSQLDPFLQLAAAVVVVAAQLDPFLQLAAV